MKKIWDGLGIAFSSACVLHCITVAFLPLFFPAIAVYTHQTWIHVFVGILVLFTSSFAFVPGYRKHGLTWIMVCAIFGLTFILLGLISESFLADQVSHSISILGSGFLVFAHAKNIQHSHRHHHQCC